MPFDFKRLARGGAIASITAALFDALPNKAEGYGYLRAVQKTILDAWSPRRGERDLRPDRPARSEWAHAHAHLWAPRGSRPGSRPRRDHRMAVSCRDCPASELFESLAKQ